MNLLNKALQEALARNADETARWITYKNEQNDAARNLTNFQKNLEVEVMVPIGSKALMSGYLYHTNEILVSHYTDLYSKCSTHKSLEILKSRLKLAEERLKCLQVEHDMYQHKLELPYAEDAFLSDGQQEIIEEYNEEEEIKWHKLHRQRVREHKQREAKLRAKGESLKENESDSVLMEQLKELELLEELEEELDDLNLVDESDSKDSLQKMMSGEVFLPVEKKRVSHLTNQTTKEKYQKPEEKLDNFPEKEVTSKASKTKRKSLTFSDVKFVQPINEHETPSQISKSTTDNSLQGKYDPELTLQLTIKHADRIFVPLPVTPQSEKGESTVSSPADIYTLFSHCMKNSPSRDSLATAIGSSDGQLRPILKNKEAVHKETHLKNVQLVEDDDDENDYRQSNTRAYLKDAEDDFKLILGDIIERTAMSSNNYTKKDNKDLTVETSTAEPKKRISRFRAARENT